MIQLTHPLAGRTWKSRKNETWRLLHLAPNLRRGTYNPGSCLSQPNPMGHRLSPPAAVTSRYIGGFVIAYLLLDWVSYIYPMAQFNITPWNPQPALAIVLLMRFGQRWLPLVTGTILLAEYLIRDSHASWQVAVLTALVLSLCYGAIAHLLSHRHAVALRLASGADVLRLIAVSTLGTLATGLLYVAALVASGVGSLSLLPEALLRFWIGDSVGILVFLPLLLMLADGPRRASLIAFLRRPEALAQGISIVAILAFVFGQSLAEQVRFFYLLFLPLVWISARAGLMGNAVAALLIQTGIIVAVHFTGQSSLTVFEFQTFLIALTIMGLFLGVTVDEREQAERALRQSQKLAAAGQMAAVLTHELSQPLTALANYARAGQLLVAAGESERTRLDETMQKLVAESRRTADVVRRLRDFLQHGAMRMEPLDLPALTERLIADLQANAAAAGVELHQELVSPPQSMLADALQLEIVLRNLLRNAIESAREAPAGQRTVTLEIRATEGRVTLSCIDSGSGIRPEQLEHLFEPFETTKASGMGMGLAVSRAIVEAHQGRLWAEPGPPGIFHLTLPTGDNEHA